MKQKLSALLVGLFAGLFLLTSGCSGRVSDAEMAALRESYPRVEIKIPETVYALPNIVTTFDWYWDEGATSAAIVEVTGDYYDSPFTARPVDEDTDAVEVGSWDIVFLPVKVEKVLTGGDSVVKEGAELYLHLGSIEFLSEGMLNSYQEGTKFLVFLLPSIGRLPPQSAAENIYSAFCQAYVTDNDVLLNWVEQDNIFEKYNGYPVRKIEKDLQKSFQAYQKKTASE